MMALVSSVPPPAPPPTSLKAETRAVIDMEQCTDPHWVGPCTYIIESIKQILVFSYLLTYMKVIERMR